MRWRNVGPYRGGRTKAAAGHPSQPYTFYIGVCNGGVWKTTDAGRTWTPIFDDQPTGSIGSVAVAPSDPERHLRRQRRRAARGRISRSATASTSRPTPARRGRISACATRSRFRTSPSIRRTRIVCSSRCSAIRTARTRSAASSDRPTAAGRSRRCSTRTRTPAATTSTSIRRIPNIVYATLWEERQGPWENARVARHRRRHLQVHRRRHDVEAADAAACPNDRRPRSQANPRDLRRALPAAACTRRSRSRRAARRCYRSDDARRDVDGGNRPTRGVGRIGGGDLVGADRRSRRIPTSLIIAEHRVVEVDRRRQDVGAVQGRAGRRRLPERLDQPERPEHHAARRRPGRGRLAQRRPVVELLVQPADRAALSRECRQRVSRIACAAASRRADRRASRAAATTAQITFREWHPVGVEEYGYAAPDPLDPDIVYGGKVTRYDRRTAQNSNVGPTGGGRGGGPVGGPRAARRCARSRSCSRPSIRTSLFYGNNVLWKTIDGGMHWKQISPDLTRKTGTTCRRASASTARERAGTGAPNARAASIYTIAPSLHGRQPHLGRHRRRRDSDDGGRRRCTGPTSRRRR